MLDNEQISIKEKELAEAKKKIESEEKALNELKEQKRKESAKKNAHWKETFYNHGRSEPFWICTCCNSKTNCSVLSEFCPHCGTKMNLNKSERLIENCPFCNNKPIIQEGCNNDFAIEYIIKCEKCIAMPGAKDYSVSAAIKKWNERKFEMFNAKFYEYAKIFNEWIKSNEVNNTV